MTMLVDPLSDLLRTVRLDGAYFYRVEGGGQWHVEAVAARELSPRVLPGAEHLISYHILLEGRCHAGLVGKPQVELAAGEAVLFPHGDPHVVSSHPAERLGPATPTTGAGRYAETLKIGDDLARTSSFVCGFLGCDRRPFNPLLASLPKLLHMRGMSDAWIATLTRRVTQESQRGGAGSGEVLIRLAELLFIEVLRKYLGELGPEQTGWLAGLRDEVVGRALALLHAQPGHSWTLAELARESNTSRSRLAERFAALVGQPPMQYLTQWRMQVAANRLLETADKVAAIGTEVGYGSEAAFSRAFKQATGLAPGAWREARRQDPT